MTPADLASSLRGHLELEAADGGIAPLRLPGWTRVQHADGGIDRMSAQSSGVHLRVLTSASVIHLDATFTRTASRVHPARPFRLVAETGTGEIAVIVDEGDVLVEAPDRSSTREPGSRSRVRFDLGPSPIERPVTIWLPTSAATVVHGVGADAELRAVPVGGPRWIHHGSSISHGSDLIDPRGPWPHQVARALGLDLVNMGFAGNAMLDPFVATAIARASADLITVKIGINLVNGDAMRARTFVPAAHNFLDVIRAGHPGIPIVVVTALACPIHEDTTGPTREVSPGKAGGTAREIPEGDGSLTLRRTRALLERVVGSRDDPALHVVDGRTLLSEADGHLPDNLHPDQVGHDLVAQRFTPVVRGLLAER